VQSLVAQLLELLELALRGFVGRRQGEGD
jgi:hypothetical protein